MRLIFSMLLLLNMIPVISISQNNQKKAYPVDPQLGFSTGPQINEKAPEFSLPDQNGNIRSLKELIGENGALLNFYRSASW